jgi:hypothetical protein
MRSGVDVRVRVEGISVVADFSLGGVEALRRRLVDKVMPWSIERRHSAVIDAYQEGLKRLLRKRQRSERHETEDGKESGGL